MNGGRNYNGPKVRFASLSKIWLYAGKSEYPTLRDLVSHVKMCWAQTISRKDQWKKSFTEILRDCMPDSTQIAPQESRQKFLARPVVIPANKGILRFAPNDRS